MAQTAIKTTDTEALFRDNAEAVGVKPYTAHTAGQQNLKAPQARNDDDFDADEFEKTSTGEPSKRRKYKPNSDAELLAQRSGYVRKDEATRDGAHKASEEARMVRVAQQNAISNGSGGGLFSNIYNNVTSTIGNWYDSATKFGSDLYNSAANTIGNAYASGKQLFVENVYNPTAQAASDLKNWGSEKLDQAGSAISDGWGATKNYFGFGENEPEQQTAKPEQVVAQEVAKPDAAAQKLSGDDNNPKADISLKSTWDSIADGVSSTLGFNAPAPAPANAHKLTR